MFDYYAHKRDMQQLARENEERRIQLQAQQEREERERIAEEERQHEVKKLERLNYNYLKIFFLPHNNSWKLKKRLEGTTTC